MLREKITHDNIIPTYLRYRYNRDVESIQTRDENKCSGYTKYGNIDGNSTNEGNGSFVNLVITRRICKDPWGRLVLYISFKVTQCSCMCYSEMISSIKSALTNEPPFRRGSIATGSLARG